MALTPGHQENVGSNVAQLADVALLIDQIFTVAGQISTEVPTSKTRSVGSLKKRVALSEPRWSRT